MRAKHLGIKLLESNKEVIQNKLIITIGELAEKYKCSLNMIELAIKNGIDKELSSNKNYTINEFRIAKKKVLKNINKDLDYYKKSLNEIELVPVDSDIVPISQLQKLLAYAKPEGVIDNFIVYLVSDDNYRCIILADDDQNIAGYVTFISRNNDTIWQSIIIKIYNQYKGQKLAGKIYKLINEKYKKHIQSSNEQSKDGRKLWTKTLPDIGINPMIYDTETGHIIDPSTTNIDMYPLEGTLKEKQRYTWIIENNNFYSKTDLLTENILSRVMVRKGKWYDHSVKKHEYDGFKSLVSKYVNKDSNKFNDLS
jgi:hypothetical protein